MKALNDTEWHLRLIDRITGLGICLLDPKGHVSSWNAGAEAIKGYKAEEIIGQHYSCFFSRHEQDAGEPRQVLKAAREDGEYTTEGWCIRKDGSRFWASAVVSSVLDDDGDLIGFAVITRDCTEQNKARRAIDESESNFRLLVQGVTDYAIYMLDKGGHVTNWNAGAQRAKGYTEKEVLGRHFSLFYSAKDRKAGLPGHALEEARTKGRFEAAGWRYRKDGSRFWANVVIDPIYDKGELIGFAKITRDITQQKLDREKLDQLVEQQRRTMKQLEKAAEEAQAANVAKSAFLANMSHEIRTPMNGILGMAELLLESELTERERTFAQTIVNSGNALLTVINDVLDFSKIESNKLELDIEPFDLCAAVEDVATLLDARAQEKGLEVIVRCDGDLPRSVKGDGGRIRQIITNIAGNAVKFTNEGFVLINVISAGDEENGSRRWRIEVEDTGIGIADEKLEVIFDEFSQAEETTTRLYGGTGLGLAISRQLVTLMGGEIG